MSDRGMPVAPVIVLGEGLTVLGVLRILGRCLIPAIVATAADDLVCDSRWYRPAPSARNGLTPESGLAPYLEALPIERAVLMPCSDHWLREVASLPEPLARRFPSSICGSDVLEIFLDKGRFAQKLDELGIPHARSRPVPNVEALESFPDEAFASAFFKPRDSQSFNAMYGIKGMKVASRNDAIRTYQRITNAGFELILQDYIPGPPSNYYYVSGVIDRHGTQVATFSRQRLRMFPLDFGNSTYMVSASLEEAAGAVDSIRRLLGAVGYRGIFSAEFKLDQRDGTFRIIEVNARPWWYVEFVARCGVDVCRLAYLDALDLPVPHIHEYQVGRRCVYPYHDYLACRTLHRAGQLSLASWAWSWLTAEQPVFRWSDPQPVIHQVASMIRHRADKLLNRGG